MNAVEARCRNPERSEGPDVTLAAGPVSRILFPPFRAGDGHSSRRHITVPLQRPTRKLWRTEPARSRRSCDPCALKCPGGARWPAWTPRTAGSSPIWSCSVWGFPCHPGYPGRGALLPHLFTLTPPVLLTCTRALHIRAFRMCETATAGEHNRRGGIFSVALSVHGA